MWQARILIVDDEAANTLLLERTLRGAGYDRLTALNDPERVVETYEETHPDLLLLDLHMPRLDGFAVLERLGRRIARDEYVPILVLTADVSAEARQRALALGAKDFLTKPFDRTEVLQRIENLMQTRSLHLELKRQNELLEDRVKERTAELEASLRERRLLLSRLVTVQEEERRRIANDVHDDSVQVMVAAEMRLEILRRVLDDPEQLAVVDELEETVLLSITRLRNLLFELHPPTLETEGLDAALRSYLDHSFGEGDPAWSVTANLHEEPPEETRVILYRIAQEILVNARKHARAAKIEVTLDDEDDEFRMTIRDDGVGFRIEDAAAAAPGHLGLASVRERAQMAGGSCRVESAPGRGTTVEIRVPGASGATPLDGPSAEWPGTGLAERL